MKNILLLALIVLSTNIFAQEKHLKLFRFKSAIIEYKYEASFKGTHIKYIDDWGYKQADYIKRELNFGGNNDKEYETIILIGSKAYTINHQENTVAIGRNSTYNYYLLNQNRKCTDVSDALLKSANGYKLDGTKEFLGKECKVWKARKATQFTWNGIMLKSEINFMTMMIEVATKIDVDVDIQESKFEIPQGIKYISSDTYQGFSGLELNFDEVETKPETDDKSIKISFNSSDLEGCDNFVYFSENGDKIISEGVNDYNKIDYLIIKSQQEILSTSKTELPQSSTLIFETNSGDFGKMQIEQINKDGYKIRYVVFNSGRTIKTHSNKGDNLLENDFTIASNESNFKLIITPKNEAKCFVLGW
ncbi:MAG: hypothetical protein L3J11_00415 [Draconibacterium sp.]|nr:hypothetical protein [Draconibacterium sp.]